MKAMFMRLLVRLLQLCCRSPAPLSARGLRLTVLVPGYAGLGNFIMMTPLFAAIKREFPVSRVILVAGNPWGAEHVLAGSGLVDRTVIVPENAAPGLTNLSAL